MRRQTGTILGLCFLMFTVAAGAADSAVRVDVDFDGIVRTLDATMFGVNTAIWDAPLDTPDSIASLREAAPLALRFPGGSISDEYHWVSNSGAPTPAHWPTSFANFMHVATNLQSQVVITVNYGSGTPEEAAAWVRCANVTNHCQFQYWEIGNENYGNWERDDNVPAHDPLIYARRARDYFAQMKAADPAIKIGVPVTEDYWFKHDRWTPALLSALKDEGVTPDFVIYHYYPQLPGRESDATLLQAASQWPDKAAYVRQLLNKQLGPAGAGVEVFCTENNSIPLKPGKQTTGLVNGLFLADSFGQISQTEFKAFFWWNWRNGLNDGGDKTNNNSASLYGWRNYGSYGMLSRDRYPAFYTFKLLQWFARPGDSIVHASSDDKLLAVYAARRTNGSLALLVINKSPTNALTAIFSIANFQPAPSASVYDYGIPQDEAARTGAGPQDIAQSVFSGAAPQFSRVFPPYSATVIAFSSQTRAR
jgi:alpha-L-arabinofuranosidase